MILLCHRRILHLSLPLVITSLTILQGAMGVFVFSPFKSS